MPKLPASRRRVTHAALKRGYNTDKWRLLFTYADSLRYAGFGSPQDAITPILFMLMAI